MRKIANYDRLASVYDRLKGLVFGSSTERAQQLLLRHIHGGNRMMIAGGGTGQILESIGRAIKQPLDIVYVELSSRMLAKAQQRDVGIHKIVFVHSDIEYFDPGQGFDIVLTPFLFDNFAAEKGLAVFKHLHSLLRPGGQWLFTDFDVKKNGPLWQQGLLWLMYRFFRIFSNIKARQLPGVAAWFAQADMQAEQSYRLYGGFIYSVIYRKAL